MSQVLQRLPLRYSVFPSSDYKVRESLSLLIQWTLSSLFDFVICNRYTLSPCKRSIWDKLCYVIVTLLIRYHTWVETRLETASGDQWINKEGACLKVMS